MIHRDLQPANIKVPDDGTVKVLDCGLAKALQPDASDPNMSMSPTISLTAAATQMGMVIGTAAYMAPDQASARSRRPWTVRRELVEGPTLARRCRSRLQPANIKVPDDGTVKVLDCGLAKALQPDASDPNMSMSPTISLTAAATQMGMVIGTAAYMAPDQASGKTVDRRADVWAFGVVLYEILVGQRLFSGENVSHTLADVLTKEIDWTSLPKDTPGTLRRLLRRGLERNPRTRMRDIGEARIAGGTAEPAEHPADRSR